MSSTTKVNFSVRQNKSLERGIVFDGIARIVDTCALEKLVYVGLGSVWFTDFHQAHYMLGVKDMHSIECDPVIAARAKFNRPYRTLLVHKGFSHNILPKLLARRSLVDRPWIVWLDYDDSLSKQNVQELVDLIRDLPPNSFLLTTFQAQQSRYKKLEHRADYLGEIFGKPLTEPVELEDLRSYDRFPMFIAKLVEDHLVSAAVAQGRPGGYLRAFRIAYSDGAPMVTVGGFLGTPDDTVKAAAITTHSSWAGVPPDPIVTPPLTANEVAALLRRLPLQRPLTRADVQSLGFDLEESQVKLFQAHYLNYPTFAQIARN